MEPQEEKKVTKIGLDIDGVCYDFVQALIDYSHNQLGFPEYAYAKTWDFYKDQWLWTTQEFLDRYAEGILDGFIWSGSRVFEESVQYTNKLFDSGYEIYFITNRAIPKISADLAYAITEQWLLANDYKYTALSISSDKTSIPTDFFLEDNVDNYLALEKAGTKAVLYNRPWNQHLEDATRVSSWKEFYDLVTI